jgi:hypothetical protein
MDGDIFELIRVVGANLSPQGQFYYSAIRERGVLVVSQDGEFPSVGLSCTSNSCSSKTSVYFYNGSNSIGLVSETDNLSGGQISVNRSGNFAAFDTQAASIWNIYLFDGLNKNKIIENVSKRLSIVDVNNGFVLLQYANTLYLYRPATTTVPSTTTTSGSTTTISIPPDRDGDGVPDAIDNCPDNCNTMQLDADMDGIGDVCDKKPGCGKGKKPACEQQC